MKHLLFFAAAVLFGAVTVTAQTTPAEQEVATFLAKLRDPAVIKDLKFVEASLAPDYTYSSAQGAVENRAEALDYLRKLNTAPAYRTLANDLRDQKIRLFGDIAVVTGNFRLVTEFKTAHPNDPPHVDEGRYTAVLQKRGGRWVVLMEHDSEKPHDKPLMQKQIAALSRAYTDMIRRADATAIASMLADDYIVTDENGARLTKEQDLATYKDRAKTVKIDTVEYEDQNVRMITGSVAVEHSTIRFVGMRNSKPFDLTERITTTWHFRDGRWLIAADHFSFVNSSFSAMLCQCRLR